KDQKFTANANFGLAWRNCHFADELLSMSDLKRFAGRNLLGRDLVLMGVLRHKLAHVSEQGSLIAPFEQGIESVDPGCNSGRSRLGALEYVNLAMAGGEHVFAIETQLFV